MLDLQFDDDLAADHFLREASADHPALDLAFDAKGSPRGTHRLIGKVESQSSVDQIVDLLRAKGISIKSLDIKRPSLEDSFMKLVGAVASQSVEGGKGS